MPAFVGLGIGDGFESVERPFFGALDAHRFRERMLVAAQFDSKLVVTSLHLHLCKVGLEGVARLVDGTCDDLVVQVGNTLRFFTVFSNRVS